MWVVSKTGVNLTNLWTWEISALFYTFKWLKYNMAMRPDVMDCNNSNKTHVFILHSPGAEEGMPPCSKRLQTSGSNITCHKKPLRGRSCSISDPWCATARTHCSLCIRLISMWRMLSSTCFTELTCTWRGHKAWWGTHSLTSLVLSTRYSQQAGWEALSDAVWPGPGGMDYRLPHRQAAVCQAATLPVRCSD